MIFRPDMVPLVLDGRKTVTRRVVQYRRFDSSLLPCGYEVGRDYAVQGGRGRMAVGRIRVLDVRRERLELPITWTEARLEGFASPRAFADRWRDLYGPNPPLDVWRIEFEAIR